MQRAFVVKLPIGPLEITQVMPPGFSATLRGEIRRITENIVRGTECDLTGNQFDLIAARGGPGSVRNAHIEDRVSRVPRFSILRLKKKTG